MDATPETHHTSHGARPSVGRGTSDQSVDADVGSDGTLGTGSDLQRLCHPGHRLSDNQAEMSVISRRIYDWDGGTTDGVTHGS